MPILIKLLVALLALNSALTFQNRWPTVGVRWTPELSIDLAVLLLVLALAAARWSLAGRALRNALIGVYLALILGRYVDVTVPALMGRSINLYWDSQHVPRVAALFADSVARWQLLLGALALLAFLAALIALLRWALGDDPGRVGATGRPPLAGCAVPGAAGAVRRRSSQPAPADRALVRVAGCRDVRRADPIGVGRDRVSGSELARRPAAAARIGLDAARTR
ncbi:MAG: hypothetical protein V9H25_08650 [Candidatus Competibacter sp.]